MKVTCLVCCPTLNCSSACIFQHIKFRLLNSFFFCSEDLDRIHSSTHWARDRLYTGQMFSVLSQHAHTHNLTNWLWVYNSPELQVSGLQEGSRRSQGRPAQPQEEHANLVWAPDVLAVWWRCCLCCFHELFASLHCKSKFEKLVFCLPLIFKFSLLQVTFFKLTLLISCEINVNSL